MSALIIDTSTHVLHLGLYHANKLIAWESLPHANQLSNFLLPSINTLLQVQGLSPRDLHYIAVGTGPGSFTGTRVGVIVCMSLSFSLDIPHIGFSSLLIDKPRELLIAHIQEKFKDEIYDLEINYQNFFETRFV
ncbi:MAG: tRNA (adenosine(37)-N6)-threonylcarbamoyltransferase complex dimerization subunit type 1 TsaB [Chlamydiota bacterium]